MKSNMLKKFLDDDGMMRELDVYFDYVAGCAERRYGHPDDWHSGEGPEITILYVQNEKGHDMPDKEWQAIISEDDLIGAVAAEMEARASDY